MNDLLYQLLSCTLIMSLIGGIFLLIRRWLGERYAPRFRYYTWLVILLGFCLPWKPRFSPQVLLKAVPSDAPYGLSQQAPLLLYLYLVGLLGFVVLRIWQHQRFCSSAERLAILLADGPLYQELKNVCREMGLDREFSLAVVPGLASPMMTGLLRPRILLPTQAFTPEQMRLIFRHELVHHQRKDLWYKLLLEIAHGIHWFNPLLPLFKREIEQDLETSCDQRVIFHSTREEQLLYCHAILQVVRAQGGLHTTFSTSFGNNKEAIQRRFEEILSQKRRRSFLAVGSLVLVLTLLSGQLLYITDNADGRVWGLMEDRFGDAAPYVNSIYTLGGGDTVWATTHPAILETIYPAEPSADTTTVVEILPDVAATDEAGRIFTEASQAEEVRQFFTNAHGESISGTSVSFP